MRGRTLLYREAFSPAPPFEERGRGDAGGEAASLREAPLPQTPSPEERLAFGVRLSFGLVPPEGWVRFPAAWLWSRRLTAPSAEGAFWRYFPQSLP